MPPAWENSLWMRAARREPVERTPVWLMRQAGRYMAEYRAVREKTGFLELCKTPSLAAEVMLTAVGRLGVDAAIIFSDLLPILEPMGLNLVFTPADGPKILNPIQAAEGVDRVRELEDLDQLEFVMETVRQTRAGLDGGLPLIGFAGAPFTLASYAIEGGASKNFTRTKQFMYSHTSAWNSLLERIGRAVSRYLIGQVEAGAQAVQLFDSWAGCLCDDDYREYVLPHTRAVIETVPEGVPVVNFATGNPALLPLLSQAGGSVIGIDWRIDIDRAWQLVGRDKAVQGNLDPAVLLTDPKIIKRRVWNILDAVAGRPGHIFNLGHGVLPQTPVENAIALVEAIHDYNYKPFSE